MKSNLVVLLFGLICLVKVNAQTNQAETEKLLSSVRLLDDTKSESDLLIKQIGNASQPLITTEQGLTFSNKAYISQTGSGHKTTISQKGNNNEANLWSDGSFTNTNVSQTGNNNSITSKFQNNTIQFYSTVLQQTGDDNSIELTLLGNKVFPDNDPFVSVIQSGKNHKFSGEYEAPFVIEQKSGINGAGMTVNVTTSAFSFSMK